jgi:branched-chain amino acid aminotransferase
MLPRVVRREPLSNVELPAAGQRVVFWNGRFVPESEARISIYDSALMFGDMVFEMTRSFNRRQFKLREHLERLYASMKAVRIPQTMTIEAMEQAVYDTIDANAAAFAPDDEHRVMIDVSRGLLSIYQGIVGVEPGPNVIIAVFPLRWTVASMGPLFESGINAVIPSQRAIPASLLDPKIKNRSRLFYMMANIEVSEHRGDNNWALLLDPDGHVAEGTGDNFFIVRKNTILSPEGRNILRGISREYVMRELAPQCGFDIVETNFGAYDVMTADEAFMTGTPFCLLPVTSLNGDPIGDGRVGAVTRRLLAQWSANVGVDVAAQIQVWGQTAAASSGPSPYAFKRR